MMTSEAGDGAEFGDRRAAPLGELPDAHAAPIMDDEDAIREDHRREQQAALAVAQGDDLCAEFAAAFAINPLAAREMLDYLLERVQPDQTVVLMRLQEAERRIDGYFNGVFNILRSQFQRQLSSDPELLARQMDLLRTFDVMCLALGFADVAGTDVPAELARRYRKSKETINKPLNEFQTRLRLMKRAGQRPAAACETMAASRIDGIKKRKDGSRVGQGR